MYKLVVTTLMLSITFYLFSQEYEYVPFPDSGAIWSEIYYPKSEIGEKTSYERFAFSGEDTIINSLIYKKLYIFYDTIFDITNAFYIGGIREDSLKRVYYFGEEVHDLKPEFYLENDPNEILLYDFSLKEGDTLRFSNSIHNGQVLFVSKIDTILIGNMLRKKFIFKYYNKNNYYYDFVWIEGIGSTRGLLFVSGDTPTNNIMNHLICFKQKNELLYFNNFYSECFPTKTGFENIYSNSISVYPNPVVDGVLIFNFGDIEINSIEIYNINGFLIDKANTTNLFGLNITTKKYSPGTYLYTAKSKHITLATGRFIIK